MYFEEKNFLTEEECSVIESEIMSSNFPWYYQDYSTSDKFPFHSHVIIPRCQEDEINPVNSTIYNFFLNIIDRFREKHDMEKTPLLRACLNSSSSFDKYPHSDVHVDHHFSHKTIIVYLNDDFEGGDTILFGKYWCEGLNTNYRLESYDPEEFSELTRISPEKYKAVCFDGRIFHATEWVKNNKRRVIFIATFK
jgi:hypothetical protein